MVSVLPQASRSVGEQGVDQAGFRHEVVAERRRSTFVAVTPLPCMPPHGGPYAVASKSPISDVAVAIGPAETG